MAHFNLDDYETVETRLAAFWKDHPNGRTFTKALKLEAMQYVFMAEIYFDAADLYPKATGHAEETVQGRGVNATSACENGETSALGRALANCGYAAKGKRPSREEMSKVAGADKVRSEIDEVKAKMAETSKQYIPVPVADDIWTTHPTQAPQTAEEAIDVVKSILNVKSSSANPSCEHGERIWATGTSKAGKPWGMMKCTLIPAKQCAPIWYEIIADGSWAQQKDKY